MYQVLVGKQAVKQALRMPEQIQKRLANLVEDLRRHDPGSGSGQEDDGGDRGHRMGKGVNQPRQKRRANQR